MKYQIDGQMDIFKYFSEKSSTGGCGSCICESCLYRRSSRCPYGFCFDDKRARADPYDKAHPEKSPRTAWSNWNKPGEQAHWCRGGIFYPVYYCEKFVQYEDSTIEECMGCNVQIYQDGYMYCTLKKTIGCDCRRGRNRDMQRAVL